MGREGLAAGIDAALQSGARGAGAAAFAAQHATAVLARSESYGCLCWSVSRSRLPRSAAHTARRATAAKVAGAMDRVDQLLNELLDSSDDEQVGGLLGAEITSLPGL